MRTPDDPAARRKRRGDRPPSKAGVGSRVFDRIAAYEGGTYSEDSRDDLPDRRLPSITDRDLRVGPEPWADPLTWVSAA
jgi:hypothetical protein